MVESTGQTSVELNPNRDRVVVYSDRPFNAVPHGVKMTGYPKPNSIYFLGGLCRV